MSRTIAGTAAIGLFPVAWVAPMVCADLLGAVGSEPDLALGLTAFIGPIVVIVILYPEMCTKRGLCGYLSSSGLVSAWRLTIIAVAIASLMTYRIAGMNAQGESMRVAVLVALQITIIGLWLGISIALLAPIRASIERRKMVAYPDATVVHGLVVMLSDLEQRSHEWEELSFRSELIVNLEQIARAMELAVSSQTRVRGSGLALWGDQVGKEIAAGIRGYERWIITPKADTRKQLIERLAEALVWATKGELGMFERLVPDKVSAQERWRLAGKSVLRTGLISILPALVFLLIQISPLRLGQPFREYATVGIGLWAALTVLAAIDPIYSAKINSIKDIIGMIFPFSKGQGKE